MSHRSQTFDCDGDSIMIARTAPSLLREVVKLHGVPGAPSHRLRAHMLNPDLPLKPLQESAGRECLGKHGVS